MCELSFRHIQYVVHDNMATISFYCPNTHALGLENNSGIHHMMLIIVSVKFT
jgi:hypothetical protein